MDSQILLTSGIGGAFVSLIISFLRYLLIKPQVKRIWVFLFSFVISIFTGIAIAFLSGVHFNDFSTIFVSITSVLASANVTYNLIMQGVGLDKVLEKSLVVIPNDK